MKANMQYYRIYSQYYISDNSSTKQSGPNFMNHLATVNKSREFNQCLLVQMDTRRFEMKYPLHSLGEPGPECPCISGSIIHTLNV